VLKKISKIAGVLAAPWAYTAGRIIGDPRISALAIRLDSSYIRGYDQRIRSLGRSSNIMTSFSVATKLCVLAESGADEVIKEFFSRSHSQLLQDIVCMLIHSQKRNGYFVEIGVGNGTNLSNTLMLERDFGWSGILAEPSRGFHDQIKRARSAILDTRAVFKTTGAKMQLEEVVGLGELSGLSGYRAERGKQDVSSYEVETVTLNDLLAMHRAPSQIDYMSIDTEGTEIEVLIGLDLKKYSVGFFTIEHNHNLQKLAAIRSILLPAGYQEILVDVSLFDAWFVHRDLAPSIFDCS